MFSPILFLIMVNLRIIDGYSAAITNQSRPELVRLPRSVVSNFWWKMLVKHCMKILEIKFKRASFLRKQKF